MIHESSKKKGRSAELLAVCDTHVSTYMALHVRPCRLCGVRRQPWWGSSWVSVDPPACARTPQASEPRCLGVSPVLMYVAVQSRMLACVCFLIRKPGH